MTLPLRSNPVNETNEEWEDLTKHLDALHIAFAEPAALPVDGVLGLRDHLEQAQQLTQSVAAQWEHEKRHAAFLKRDCDRIQHELDRLKTECNHLREINGGFKERTEEAEKEAAEREKQSHELRDELLEVYRDLRAEDLPTLIVRIAMRVTGAEQGLYFDANASDTLSAVGLDELDAEPRNGLYRIAQNCAESGESATYNNAEELPDGLQLVNVAAVPVSMKGEHHGILLVANKRGGAFTDHDTDVLLSIGRHAGVAIENRNLHCQLTEAFQGTVAVLADAIEAKDPYTRGHCENVADLAVKVGKRLGLGGADLESLKYAALLHDVGKIAVADSILLKPGRLSGEEYETICRHSVIGRDLVSRIPGLSSVAPLVLYHHERVDGTGYPKGLRGEDIPLGARIIAVVDALDAMISVRPYRTARTLLEAIDELHRCAGVQFDPLVVAVVEQILLVPNPADVE